MGIERLVLLLKQQEDQSGKIGEIDVFIAGLGEEAADYSFKLMHELRGKGVRVDMDLDGKSLKSQMKQADRAGARHVLIIGSQELADNKAPLRDMETGEQTELDLDSIASFFTDALES